MTPRTADRHVYDQLYALRVRMTEVERNRAALVSRAPDDDTRASAANLLHYTALREGDLRPLQRQLLSRGLSSLGRSESWVLGCVSHTLHAAGRLCDPPMPADEDFEHTGLTLDQGRSLLDRRTDALFGPRPQERAVRIMVTMPDEAAHDASFVAGCLDRGMDAMRINTAAGDADDWLAMIGHLRRAQDAGGRACRVFADLGGPKIRITSITVNREPSDAVRLNIGDRVRLAFTPEEPHRDALATLVVDAPHLVSAVDTEHAVWFNDGKVGARVDSRDNNGLDLEITFAKPGGQRLRVGKGVNVPDTTLDTAALTDEDRDTLRQLWGRVDAVSLSFVRTPDDVADLRDECERLERETGRPAPAIVLKIETRAGFTNLPEILLELLRVSVGGVMLARGDLAVEVGYERMAEVQEELLCFCEAAHTPVIWATEVLSSLAKKGRPTRAEITDAAAAQRAECVMLNKGPEVLTALEMLSDILMRMQTHQRKKTPMFRPLSIAMLQERR